MGSLVIVAVVGVFTGAQLRIESEMGLDLVEIDGFRLMALQAKDEGAVSAVAFACCGE